MDSPRRRVVAATRTFGRDRRRRYASEEIAPAKRRPAPAPRYAEREVVETDHVDEVPASSLMGKVTVVDYDASPAPRGLLVALKLREDDPTPQT